MRIANARDLALLIRDRRRQRGMTQADLAEAAGVSRRWLLNLESGKPTAEIGLIFRTLDALGLSLEVHGEAGQSGDVDLDSWLLHLFEDERRD